MKITWHACCKYRYNRITPIMLADLSSAHTAGLDTPRLSQKVPFGSRRKGFLLSSVHCRAYKTLTVDESYLCYLL